MRKTWILSFLFLASTALAQPVPTIRPNPYAMNCVIPGCAWSSSTTYNVNDTVLDGGILYIAIAPHSNYEPPNGTYWAQLSASGGSMSWPGAGIAVSSGSSAWSASLTAPTGTIVGTTDSQQLSNKTFGTGMTWPTFNQSTSGTAASLSAILANTLGGTGIDSHALSGVAHVTSGTWTASAVVDANVSFTTPALGSPTGTNYTVNDGGSLVFGTSSGGKIGTSTLQKLAFYNSTPIAKPSGSALTALSNLGLVTTPTIAATDLSSAQVALARGGTNADTSATGPGFWCQKTTGAAVTIEMGQVYNVKFYGAIGNGSADDTTAIQAAISAIPVTGGVVYLPAGNYKITSTLTIGNGTSSTISTTNGVVFEGDATGSTADETNAGLYGTKLLWYGAAGQYMLKVNGPIGSVEIRNIYGECKASTNAASGFLYVMHAYWSTFENLVAYNYATAAFTITAYNSMAGPAALGQGANHNTWSRVRAYGSGAGASAYGLVVGPTTTGSSPHLDVAGNSFNACLFVGGASGYGIQLNFTDNDSFLETSGTVQVVPPSGTSGSAYPAETAFYNCPVMSTTVTGTWAPASSAGLFFWPLPIADGESVPSNAYISGITSAGVPFGGFPGGMTSVVTVGICTETFSAGILTATTCSHT